MTWRNGERNERRTEKVNSGGGEGDGDGRGASEMITTIIKLKAENAELRAEMDEMRKQLPVETDEDYWWCPECCEEVHPKKVTYYEYHETCGQHVICKRAIALAIALAQEQVK
jgi:hypothetical protein